ncbi:MAG TPA: hypothetical protein VHK28_10095 [Candidatus Limnocylindria bacterium]|nr:hypothetical protein [Candidatus Limnocylindria bacterium]
MSGRRGRRGRPYQPLPQRHVNWGARLLIVFVAFVMVAGFAILTFAR